MASSANYAFPSPEGNQAPQGPYSIKALADAVDAALATAAKDSGWVNVDPASGFSWQSATPFQVRKVGPKVDARWGFSNAGMAANTVYTVATIPSGYRPAQTGYFWWVNQTGTPVARGVVYSSGAVELATSSTLTTFYLVPLGLGWFVN